MPLRVFFRYFPPTAWLILLGGIVLKIVVPDPKELSNMIINFTALYFCFKVRTIIHECGHLVAASWVGGKPKRMILGMGHEVYRFEWRGIKIVMNSVPIGGMALALFDEQPHMRGRWAVFVMGGVLFNAIAAGIFYLLFGFSLDYADTINIASVFIFANLTGILNLLPYYTSAYGFRLATDGLLLIKTLFGPYKKIFKNLKYNEECFRAFEYFELRDYERSYALYHYAHGNFPDEFMAPSMMATILLKQCKPGEALVLMQPWEAHIDSAELKKYKGVILNNIAWAHLLEGRTDIAYDYSSQAIKALPKHRTIGGTYGAILVERGSLDTGIQWLMINEDLRHPNDSTLTTSMYLMLGFYLKGDLKRSKKHRDFVEQNLSILEKDTRFLWERCLQKISK
jgi:hypothetical protein